MWILLNINYIRISCNLNGLVYHLMWWDMVSYVIWYYNLLHCYVMCGEFVTSIICGVPEWSHFNTCSSHLSDILFTVCLFCVVVYPSLGMIRQITTVTHGLAVRLLRAVLHNISLASTVPLLCMNHRQVPVWSMNDCNCFPIGHSIIVAPYRIGCACVSCVVCVFVCCVYVSMCVYVCLRVSCVCVFKYTI